MKKTGEQREHHKLYDLFESTEMKIAGKRRMEPAEWSSQTGAQPEWSRVDPRVRSPFCIDWVF